MKKIIKLLIITLFFHFNPLQLFSQTDAHYWTHQFGAKGLLLNGAVIASTEDETAVFYNPGAMSGEDDFSLSLSFLTPTYAILKTKNYLGDGNNVTHKNLSFAPGLGSLGFNPFGSKRIRMAITSFNRFKSNINFRGRVIEEVSNAPNSLFIGNLNFSRKLSERWIGIGASFRLTNFLSVGVSQFATFHSESSTFSIQKELVEKDNPSTLILGWRNSLKYSFSAKAGMLTKFGALLKLGKIKVGATLTTPTYKYFLSSAKYEYDDLKNYGQDSTILISNINSADLQGYKTPMSIGFGLDFPIRKSHISFSMEYFGRIKNYSIIDDTDDPFNGLATGGTNNTIFVSTGNQKVINFSIGGTTKLKEKLSLIWGFRTDFNQRNIDQDLQSLQFLSTTPDVFHFSIGNSIEIWNSLFSFGLDYGFGRKKDETQLVNFSNINSNNFFDFTGNGKVISNFQSLNFILAYDFRYKKNKSKK